jgi:hypothetical protein
MKAAEELEHEYERKLASEAARWEALRKDKEDVQCQLEERIYSLAVAGHDNEAKLKKERDEIRTAADTRAVDADAKTEEMTHKYEEMLAQACSPHRSPSRIAACPMQHIASQRIPSHSISYHLIPSHRRRSATTTPS